MSSNGVSGLLCRDFIHTLRRIAPPSHRRTSIRKLSSISKPHTARPLRVGIIGSGPAGFYAAARIIQKSHDALVDMYEQLPAPFGLVRYGVAPDHPEVKNCQDRFEEVAQSPRFSFFGNVNVGEDVPLRSLKPHYDALLFAYGAAEDRKLGVPGEDLQGIASARAFVGWYNGLPEYAGQTPDLQADDTAHVIGNGNVAMDVARILLSDADRLRKTDISDETLDALSRSRIKHVHVYGRRGPMQAAFTIKEVRELMTLPGTRFEPIDPLLLPQADYISKLPRLEQRKYRLAALLAKGTSQSTVELPKSWSLQSLLSPVAFESDASSTHVESMTLDHNAYNDPSEAFTLNARVQSTGSQHSVPARLVFRSIGYKSTALPGLSDLGMEFNGRSGTMPNDMHGRVLNTSSGPSNLTAQHVYGCYCTGWVKNGPTGVIASTMDDAFASADIVLRDWEDEVLFLNGARSTLGDETGGGWMGVVQDEEVQRKGVPRRVAWADWHRIDEAEKERGKKGGKLREKFKSVKDMLAVLD